MKTAPEPWLDPRSLSVYGQRAGRVVAMDAQPLALISTGQSDLYTHTVKPKLYGEANALGFSELSNPVQLMFGSFDLAFVCIYLLPLLVLAFSYNLLSADKESGVLRLTISQPISLYKWLFGKLVVRFVVLAA
ncbi:MAG TPA: ABC transporter permease subunit, partial [Cyclobacteriaceae bacterium]|nr:ABC transporter permease subunit [Cyclobacteriaceae bacterium]